MTAEEQEEIDRVASKLRQAYYGNEFAVLGASTHKAMWRRMAIAAIREVNK